EALHAQGLVPKDGYERLRSEYQVVIAAAERELRRLHERHLAHGARLLLATRRRLIDAERTALFAARRAGVVPDATAEHLLAELDARLLSLEETGRRQEDKG
ncbi:sodium:proton antiporter, partial [Myxococcota bacterium]|nr:sodium:proton antiporter [Myxococcota bacterium]